MVRLLQIDAFTGEAFRGNPAAVCILEREADATWMQNVAAEMNLAETAFLLSQHGAWSLRWFTPAVEVDLCGHATLASAHALWQEGILAASEMARFNTRSGLLTAEQRGDLIELDFPVKTVVPVEDPPPELLASLGIPEPRWVGRNEWDYLIEVGSEQELRSLTPDHKTLRKLPVRGVIVTTRGESEYDFVSRFFAPGSGIDEDPVTGSAHCALAPFWSARLGGKRELLAYQASSRGGVIRIRLLDDRVKLGGRAVTVLRGELTV